MGGRSRRAPGPRGPGPPRPCRRTAARSPRCRLLPPRPEPRPRFCLPARLQPRTDRPRGGRRLHEARAAACETDPSGRDAPTGSAGQESAVRQVGAAACARRVRPRACPRSVRGCRPARRRGDRRARFAPDPTDRG